ncbi:hypothetical protein DL96DRAFT_1681726 [Flagelloscypha sp. PMI_526]|nr:hypothetical protein DL96DRAFT_1681726 [Flagelloscypha sp. PMI_526]
MMGVSPNEYSRLESEEYLEDLVPSIHKRTELPFWRRENVHYAIIIIQTFVFVVAILVQARILHGVTCTSTADKPFSTWKSALELYTPVQDHLEYEIKLFTSEKTSTTKYLGWTDEADEAWRKLYYGTFMQLNRDEASRLPNITTQIAGKPGVYLAHMDVFHQLHCLNYLRQSINPQRYNDSLNGLVEGHLLHCVEALRQTLMCNADITTNVWQWNEQKKRIDYRTEVPHMCVNFDKLLEWTVPRGIDEVPDVHVKMENDLPSPAIIH